MKTPEPLREIHINRMDRISRIIGIRDTPNPFTAKTQIMQRKVFNSQVKNLDSRFQVPKQRFRNFSNNQAYRIPLIPLLRL
jgi:hypothetical protein